MWHWIREIISILFILAGFLLVPLPVPLGIIFIVIGFALLVTEDQHVANWVREIRGANPDLERKVEQIKGRLPENLREPFSKTDPNTEC